MFLRLNHALIASNKLSSRSIPRSKPRSHNVCTAPTASSPRPIGSHYAQTTQSLRLNNAHRVSTTCLPRSYCALITLWARVSLKAFSFLFFRVFFSFAFLSFLYCVSLNNNIEIVPLSSKGFNSDLKNQNFSTPGMGLSIDPIPRWLEPVDCHENYVFHALR